MTKKPLPFYRQRLAEVSDEALHEELRRRQAERRAAKREELARDPPPKRTQRNAP